MPAKKSSRQPNNRPGGRQNGPSRKSTPRKSTPRQSPGGTARELSNRRPTKATNRPAKTPTRSEPQNPAVARQIRLQRALAAAGLGSRRQCEELILEGRVEVDGKIVDQLGLTIDPATSKVFVDGTPLKSRRTVYYIVNKPAGVVTTNSDPEGRPRVIDLVPPGERVFPVGRLDRSSEGLILLTNDGELAQRLAHPKFEVQKVYRVTVAGNVQPETLRQMHQGIYIAEGLVRVEGARVLKARSRATEMEITLKEGKNREIRRILARLGHKVQTLKRIAIGTLRLGEMPTGAYRRLTVEEIRKLKTAVPDLDADGSVAPPAKMARSERPVRPGNESRSAKPPRPDRSQVSGKQARGGKPKRDSQSARESVDTSETPLRIAVPGVPRRRSGVVIGAELPFDDSSQKNKLPVELDQQLPNQPRRGRRDRSSRFSELDAEDLATLDREEQGRAGDRRAAGKPPASKRAGKSLGSRSRPGGIKAAKPEQLRAAKKRSPRGDGNRRQKK
jgi:23S rRNA pseudouridine2605 synthase